MPAFEAGRSLIPGEHVMLGGTPVAHHIADVLRVHAGDHITLFHAGELYDAVIENASRPGLAVVIETARPSPFVMRPLTLVQAVIRPVLLDDVVHMCSPLGVQRFVVFAAERSQPWNIATRLNRLSQVAGSSAEQAETGQAPSVQLVAGLKSALSDAGPLDTIIMMSPRAHDTMMGLAHSGGLALDGPVTIVVGPEGGFTESEEALLIQHGALPVRLGTGVLRSDLAGFAGVLLMRELQSAS